jgi:hypothetical protein
VSSLRTGDFRTVRALNSNTNLGKGQTTRVAGSQVSVFCGVAVGHQIIKEVSFVARYEAFLAFLSLRLRIIQVTIQIFDHAAP